MLAGEPVHEAAEQGPGTLVPCGQLEERAAEDDLAAGVELALAGGLPRPERLEPSLAVKSVKRSEGRSAVAAAAYRAGCRLACEREGRAHDYGRKRGVEAAFILAPEGAPAWAQDRERLWNAAEAAENRKNSIVAREWELALPCELTPEARRELAHDFARALVERFGVAADVAIHAPHPQGDQRNHHAHVLTTTRRLGAEGLGAKMRALDVASTARGEVTAVRALWCGLQNAALELAERERGFEAGALPQVDPRTLAAQREAALQAGDALQAEAREAFVEANARAWDAALWGLEQEAARRGVEAAAIQDEPAFTRERERIADRLELASMTFGEPQAALRGALGARSDALDAAAGAERAAALARIAEERAAEELARAQERLERLAEEAAALRAELEAWHAQQAAQVAQARAEAEAQAQAEAQARARSCAALAELAVGLRDWGWHHEMDAADKERLRVGLGEHLERAVGPEVVARLDQGDHAALEGVLERAEDRVALTLVRLLDRGERLGDATLTVRGRALYDDLVEAQIADERALGREHGRELDLGDDFGL